MAPDERACSGGGSDDGLLAAIRAADGLADLVEPTGADSEHEAYVAAKRAWRDRPAERLPVESLDGLPGARVVVDGQPFHVHGVTHAGTDVERSFLREHLLERHEAGAAIYCEQGVRPLYFEDVPGVCRIDDYSWALARRDELGLDSHLDTGEAPFEGLAEDVGGVGSQFQEAAFSLIDSGRSVYGEEVAATLGALASSFLTSHEDLATGDEFESFALSRRAAADPGRLVELQRYYERTFLPQPVEREWLRRHDRELELVTHARNERMADYAVVHAGSAGTVHLVVGAAHQPGVRYYLERYREGRSPPADFELVL